MVALYKLKKQKPGDCVSRHTAECGAAQETRGARQTSVYFTGVKKPPFHASVAQHSLNRNTRNYMREFPRDGAPTIPNLS